jgi:hypothetical protein
MGVLSLFSEKYVNRQNKTSSEESSIWILKINGSRRHFMGYNGDIRPKKMI